MSDRLHTREDSGLVIDREGRWVHDDEPVENEKIAQAFSRGLARAPDGRFIVRFGDDWCFVTVEDAPLQVRAAVPDAAQRVVTLRLSNGSVEDLDPETLSSREGVLYCVAAGDLPARFGRSAQVALGPLLVETGDGIALRLSGQAFPIRQ